MLIIAGLATKIGWAPVHNWLPDAHSEAPAPISALLSAALLPDRPARRLAGEVGARRGRRRRRRGALFIGFGLASIIVAVPFLWRPLPLEAAAGLLEPRAHGRDRARDRLRHPLAIAGVLLHVAGHALAKALGFYAALPLLRADPEAARGRRPASQHGRRRAAAMGVSLVALAGLPPSPLFVSELLILLGGFAAGEAAVVAVAVVALALGFLGLLHALIEGILGEPQARPRVVAHRAARRGAHVASLGAAAGARGSCVALLPGSARPGGGLL